MPWMYQVDTRSHFLPQAPILGLSESYENYEEDSLAAYTLLHEYLHYEHFTGWPILLIRYFLKILNDAVVVSRHLSKRIRIICPVNNIDNILGQYQFESVCCDEKAGANQPSTFRIGLSEMSEAAAILNFFVKPLDNPLRERSLQVLEKLLSDRNLRLNRSHIIGTESTLFAVGLGRHDLRNPTFKEILHLAALVPGFVVTKAMTQTMKDFEVELQRVHFSSLTQYLQRRLNDVLIKYLKNYDMTLHEAYHRGDPKVWTLTGLDRDLAAVGTHSLISAMHNQMWDSPEDLSYCGYLEYTAMAPLLHLIKLYEMYFQPTLEKYGIQIKPLWMPITTLIFPDKMFTSVRIDFKDVPVDRFMMRFHHTIETIDQYTAWFAWIQVAFLDELSYSIATGSRTVRCPFYRWVEDQYRSIGVTDKRIIHDHIRQMCTNGMRLDFKLKRLTTRLEPCDEYCRLSLAPTGRDEAEINCFFRSAVWHMIMNTRMSL